MVRLTMSQADLPLSFWGYALEIAMITLNRVPTKSVEKTSMHGNQVWNLIDPIDGVRTVE